MNNTRKFVFVATRFIVIIPVATILIPAVWSAEARAQSAPVATAAPLPLSPMPADANPAFEIATIKPVDAPALHGTVYRTEGRHVVAHNFSVAGLIAFAYGLHPKQIVDGPPSLLAMHFDIDGVPDVDGHPSVKQSRLMFQKLLTSRFKLTFHYDSRELPAYAIQIARDGPKLAPTKSKPGESMNFTYNCQAVLTVRNASVGDVAKGMQESFLDRPILDQTDLNGRYDFKLKWTPDESQSYCPSDQVHPREDPNAPPGLFTAIREQLGLKLVPVKAPIQVMVIDSVSTPTEN
jgi:uncharacterized protein (TIGR03435 family)